ncbi:MAG TPA: hypothetical protein VLW85_04670 [Myxococcales bacterium]|nr:hypothetical protein [Myxococcales bacterium]
MAWICACCFAPADKDDGTCASCKSHGCTDCDGKKQLLKVAKEAGAPAPDAEDYGDFLSRFEDVLLPAYRQHFENDQRKRFKTRLHVVRAMVFSQAMLNYRIRAGEKDLSPANLRYAVALRSFGKLKIDPEAEHVIHIDDSGEAAVVVEGRSGWIRRSAGAAYSYLKLIGMAEQRAAAISGLLRAAPDKPEGQLVRDAYVLDRLHKLADQKFADAPAFLAAADPVLKGQFTFAQEAAHKDAREAIICEAGLLMKMTSWQDDPGWRKQGHGALARVEKILDNYEDVFPFLVEFYFEDQTHAYKV